MQIKLSNYEFLIPIVKYVIEKDLNKKPLRYLINITALSSSVPTIVVAHYFSKELGLTEEIKTIIDDLQEFYKYESVK